MDNAIVIKVMKRTGSCGQVTQVKVKFQLLYVGEWRGERKGMRHLEGRRLLRIEMPLQLPLPNPLGWTYPLATSFDSIFGTSFLALPSPTFASVALGTWAPTKHRQGMQIAMEVQSMCMIVSKVTGELGFFLSILFQNYFIFGNSKN
ncbi:hypothetical protein ACFX14_040607 [Malus domestica]